MKQNKVAANLQQNYTEEEKAQARRNIGLAEVAHSGDYNDLINKPVPINGQVQSDWNQTNEMMPDFIRNKPTIGDAVLTIRKNGSDVQTFSANSTTDKIADIAVPTKTSELQNDSGFITSSALPTVNDATLTIQKNGSTVQTFTANSSTNKTANIEVPTKTSDLQNDSGFITNASVGNGTITIQKNGSTVDTFTANQSSNKTVNIMVPTKTSDITNDSGFITLSDVPACNLYVVEYGVSTFSDVLAAYNANKAIILVGADFGINVHPQMMVSDFNTTTGQSRKFQFAPTATPHVAAYYRYYAVLDENDGWSKGYLSGTAPTKCGGIFTLSGDETTHNLIEHRGWLCNGVYNFDVKFFSSPNACNIYIGYVTDNQSLKVDVVGTRRNVRNDLKAQIDANTTVQNYVRNIDSWTRIVNVDQPLTSANPRIDIATLGPQEQTFYDYDIYWDLDLIVRQWGVLNPESPCYHLHIEKYGDPNAGHNYLFATLAGTDLY